MEKQNNSPMSDEYRISRNLNRAIAAIAGTVLLCGTCTIFSNSNQDFKESPVERRVEKTVEEKTEGKTSVPVPVRTLDSLKTPDSKSTSSRYDFRGYGNKSYA